VPTATVLRYVERNPLRANLVERAQDWRWSSLGRYTQGDDKARQLLAPWPILRPRNWASRVNRAEGKKELEAVRRSVQRGQPYGSELWCERIVQTLGLESVVRPRGRPRKTASWLEKDSRPLIRPRPLIRLVPLSASNGNERERPLGIVTATDQPKLRSAIRV